MASKHPYLCPSKRPRTFKNVASKGIQNYKFGDEIGSGAFSTVYLAQHKSTQTIVALKKVRLNRLDPKHYDCFTKEVKLLNRIKSENVVKCHESFFEKGFSGRYLCISLEHANAGDLEKIILEMQQIGRLFSERTIWYYMHQICNGIKDLHEARILHRDLKPANVFLTQQGRVKIGDLGLSRIFESQTNFTTSVVGTQYYMSPERIQQEGYHFKSDIWSLGCLFYELCTLRSPFNGENVNEYALNKKICSAKFLPFPSSIYSRQLQFFVERCLSISTSDRPTAEEAHEAANRMHLTFENLLLEHKKSVAAATPKPTRAINN